MNLYNLGLIQDDLNAQTTANWRNRLSLGDFDMAIISEFGELVDSGRKWKWWKKEGVINEWNEKIEIIDILHFVISKLLILGTDLDLESELGVDNNTLRIPSLIKIDNSFDNDNMTICQLQLLDDESPCIIDGLHALFNSFNMTSREIELIYHLKASLNYVRQRSGYTTGEYKKVLNGREDNEFLKDLFDIMDDQSQLSFVEVQAEVDRVFA